jgi:uracil-DNA glycosylase family 4
MKGFFSDSQIKKTTTTGPARCVKCGLYKTCLSPRMEPTGEGRKKILFVAEAPGEKEDKRNKQLIGDAGQLLRKVLRKEGIDLDIDCRKINSTNCRPPKNREPSDDEIAFCRPNVFKEIESFKPHIIILMGKAAIKSVIGSFWKKDLGTVTSWRGWTIPDRSLNAWICPTFHPSYIQRNGGEEHVSHLIFCQDIKKFLKFIDKPLPKFHDESKDVEIIVSEKGANLYLKDVFRQRPDWISFDYETTGLKPHAQGHEIVTCAICDGKRTGAFLAHYQSVQDSLIRILRNKMIRKSAHNLKFEQSWTKEIYGCDVEGWLWDSQIAAHILENRELITSLKFQTYVNFGVADYDSHIKPYLEGVEKNNANSFNRIHELSKTELLTYNGLDSIYGYKLTEKQMEQLGKSSLEFMEMIADPSFFIRRPGK